MKSESHPHARLRPARLAILLACLWLGLGATSS